MSEGGNELEGGAEWVEFVNKDEEVYKVKPFCS